MKRWGIEKLSPLPRSPNNYVVEQRIESGLLDLRPCPLTHHTSEEKDKKIRKSKGAKQEPKWGQ